MSGAARGARARSERDAAADAPAAWPHVPDELYESIARSYAEAQQLLGRALSDAQLAQPLGPASAAQRALLARTLAASPRL
jgi:hypothetical protein